MDGMREEEYEDRFVIPINFGEEDITHAMMSWASAGGLELAVLEGQGELALPL